MDYLEYYDKTISILSSLTNDREFKEIIPPELEADAKFMHLYQSLLEFRQAFNALEAGDLKYPIKGKGFLLGTLRSIQASMLHLIWQTNMIANGDFTQNVDFMGELSEAFNHMKNALEQTMNKLFYISYHDQLTGLYNRRFYEDELGRINTEVNLPISLIVADVNGLKLTNDAFGHKEGDNLLVRFSRILNQALGGGEMIARIGGDEFVILFPKTDYHKANKAVHYIKSLIEEDESEKTILSVSFGLATKNDINESFDKIFKQAEDNMYHEKLLESRSMKSKTINQISVNINEHEHKHSERISKFCMDIGIEMGLSTEVVTELGIIGLLHDIGKIGINEEILNKTGQYNEYERNEMKRHPEIGYQILRSVKEFVGISDYVLSHHERIDGKGYPRQLAGKQIPLQSRILSVAEAFDAMTNDRSYKPKLSVAQAIEELKANSNTQFDTEIVKVFVEKVLGEKT